MKIIKKTTLILSLAFAFGFISLVANAEETEKSSASTPNAVITHILEAKSEIMHRDFIPPSDHIKAARAASKQVAGDPKIVKKAAAIIIQAQIKTNKGDKKGATEELDKALALYKSLKAD
jgi:hypothetical protein